MKLLPRQLVIMLLLYMGKADLMSLNHDEGDFIYNQDMRALKEKGLIDWDGIVFLTPTGVERIMDFILDEPKQN